MFELIITGDFFEWRAFNVVPESTLGAIWEHVELSSKYCLKARVPSALGRAAVLWPEVETLR